MRAAVLSVALAACAYRPGSFSHFRQDFPGQRTTVGCIDLAVERRPDLTGGGTVLAYEFANRCDHAAPIDFTQVKVLARTFTGEDLELNAYDPEWQIKPQQLDGRAIGAEAIAYPADHRLAEVCVDAASLTHQSPSRWMCFGSNLPPDLIERIIKEERARDQPPAEPALAEQPRELDQPRVEPTIAEVAP